MPTIPRRDALISFARLEEMHSTQVSTDPYEQQEAHIRLRLHGVLSKDPNITSILFSDPYSEEGRLSIYDLFIVSAGTEMFLEGKERSYTSDRWTTWFIEEIKAQELEVLTRRTKIPSLWANLTTDGVCLLWDTKTPHTTRSTSCDRKTYEPSLGKTAKAMRHYEASNAIVIR